MSADSFSDPPVAVGAGAGAWNEETQAWLNAAVEHLREGLQVIDRDYCYRFVNEAAAGHGRTTPGKLTGRTMFEAFPGIEETDMFGHLRRTVEQGQRHRMLNEFHYPDGGSAWFELRFEPLPEGAMILSIDVSERVEAERTNARLREQLVQLDRLDAIGRMAAGVAHDFNNTLTAIMANSDLMTETLSEGHPARNPLLQIRQQIEQAGKLTRQLLTFGRGQHIEPEPVNLSEIGGQLVPKLAGGLGQAIRIETRWHDPLPAILADRSQIEQIFVNLIFNARDAMPAGGTLTLRTETVELDDEYLRLHAGVEAGPHVLLSISDTGQGMDEETRNRIFEPFFTTKAPGQGTGLGLPTVWGIVQRSGGHTWVYSEPGSGTTFKLYFPVSTRASHGTASAPRIDRITASGTVLLVEDDAAVRRICTRLIDRIGYRVLAAEGIEQARRLLSENSAIGCLVTDICMPDGSGLDLIDEATRARPELPVVVMSGRFDHDLEILQARGLRLRFVEKPFSGELLREVLAELFGD